MCRLLSVVVFFLTAGSCAVAQQFSFPEVANRDPAAQSKAMLDLARQVLTIYKDGDRDTYLDNLFRLQMVAHDYAQALESLSELRTFRRLTNPGRAAWVNVQYEIYAAAKLKEQSDKLSFAGAFRHSFLETFDQLDDVASALVVRALGANSGNFERDLQNDLDRQKGKPGVLLADALKLVHNYQVAEAFRDFSPLTPPLVAEDDARRYLIEKDVPVKMPDGGTVCALIVRPRKGPARLPALLEFTIYADADVNLRFGARPAASHGYVGIEGLVRGKGCSPDKPIPYGRDANDAASLIE
jgi:uncharacterized protein